MKKPGISLGELAELQRKETAKNRFTAEDERREGLRLLAEISQFSQKERARILRRAIKINEA